MTDRIEQIIAKALIQPCDNHRERAELARETARQVMEAGQGQEPAPAAWQWRAHAQDVWRAGRLGRFEKVGIRDYAERPLYLHPSPSYEDGLKEGLRRAADLCEHYAGIWEGEPVEHAKELHDLILSLLTKEEGQ